LRDLWRYRLVLLLTRPCNWPPTYVRCTDVLLRSRGEQTVEFGAARAGQLGLRLAGRPGPWKFRRRGVCPVAGRWNLGTVTLTLTRTLIRALTASLSLSLYLHHRSPLAHPHTDRQSISPRPTVHNTFTRRGRHCEFRDPHAQPPQPVQWLEK
jgi:hypothetical protein